MQKLDLEKDIHLLANVDIIIAISRGGLIPAQFVSYRAKIRFIDTINIYSYNNKDEQEDMNYLDKDYSHLKGKNILIIDDIVDNGKTMEYAVDVLSKYMPKSIKTFACYYKEKSTIKPDFYLEEVEDERWVNFIWDKKDLDIVKYVTI